MQAERLGQLTPLEEKVRMARMAKKARGAVQPARVARQAAKAVERARTRPGSGLHAKDNRKSRNDRKP